MKLHHIGVNVSHLKNSIEFFKRQFGFEKESHFIFMEEEIVFLTLGDFRLELVSSNEENQVNTHICFEVNNLTDVMAQCKALWKMEGPYELDNGWQTVFYEGPNQEIVELLQVSSANGKLIR
jgi:lactoylglutathione lyase